MRSISIAYPFIIFIEVLVFVNFVVWSNREYMSIQQYQYDMQVNYAVDGAMQETLWTATHIGTDYEEWGDLVLEPEVALNTYVAIMLKSFGWSDFEGNRNDFISEHVPFFMVCDYNGYYLYLPVELTYMQHNNEIYHQYPIVTDSNDECVLESDILDAEGNILVPAGTTVDLFMEKCFVWTPKLPYSYTGYDGIYWYNLGVHDYGYFDYNNGIIYQERTDWHNPDSSPNDNDFVPNSLEFARYTITNTVEKACNFALRAGLEGHNYYEFKFPYYESSTHDNLPITSPTIITYLNPFFKSPEWLANVYAIGGSRIVNASYCILYTDDFDDDISTGTKLYTYVENQEKIKALGHTILDIVVSPEEAVSKGHWYDIRMMEDYDR